MRIYPMLVIDIFFFVFLPNYCRISECNFNDKKYDRRMLLNLLWNRIDKHCCQSEVVSVLCSILFVHKLTFGLGGTEGIWLKSVEQDYIRIFKVSILQRGTENTKVLV